MERDILDFIREVEQRGDTGEVSQREIAQALELNSALMDYYTAIQDAIFDGSIKFDDSVTVRTENRTIKFQDIGGAAQWMTEILNGR